MRLTTLPVACVLGSSVLAGCGSSGADDIPDVPTSTGAAAKPGSVADAQRWNGTWDSTFGTMQLTAGVGGKLSGTYASCGGTVIATAHGSTLEGTWTESDTTSPKCAGRPASKQSGSFVWTLSGGTFTGTWTYGDGSRSTQGDGWQGKRLS